VSKFKLRVSDAIAPFREKAEKTWGLERYQTANYKCPLVYFGLYNTCDYQSFLRHTGKIMVVWAGGDIINLKNNKITRYFIKKKRAEHFVENQVEQEALKKMGIKSAIAPSFVEDSRSFPISYKPSKNPHIWLCAHQERQEEYGVELVKKIAKKLPSFIFHIYGASGPQGKNVIFHGKLPQDVFNHEIRKWHCGLRANEFDGNSEVAMKSIFMGQYPITRIKYPHIWNYTTEQELIMKLKNLKNLKRPNTKNRKFWKNHVNNYPFLKKNN
jgi:hypothetical protein